MRPEDYAIKSVESQWLALTRNEDRFYTSDPSVDLVDDLRLVDTFFYNSKNIIKPKENNSVSYVWSTIFVLYLGHFFLIKCRVSIFALKWKNEKIILSKFTVYCVLCVFECMRLYVWDCTLVSLGLISPFSYSGISLS